MAEKKTDETIEQPNVKKADTPAGSAFEKLESTRAEAEAIKGNAGHVIVRAQERGYNGFVPDPTPNENYTFAGQAKGAPTPETNRALKNAAASRTRLPADIPFIPGTQEEFEAQVSYEQAKAESAKAE